MSKTLPYKTFLTSFIIVCYVVLTVATGCSSHHKKRGIVLRGDWAFEINRTPWVGHPGNTDIPGMEESKDKSGCFKDKESSLTDTLLGPLASLKGRCRCKNCIPAGGNINITSYNPTVANTFPNPMTGAYPGVTPPGSISLPPGAIVVPTGVLMPNGTILPHHFFYPQPGMTPAGYNSVNPVVQQPAQQTAQPAVQGDASTMQPEQNPQPSGDASQSQSALQPQILAPGSVSHVTQNVIQNTAQPEMYGVTAPTYSPEMQAVAAQQAVLQGLNASNPMLINPAPGQVVAGLSMTGTQSAGYPPIGYAVSGYSPGFAQQVYPPLSGPMAPDLQNQQAMAANGRQQAGSSGNANAETEEPASPKHAVAMPYPRHHPMPTQPVYQRNMGMAPGYAMVRPPATSPYMQMQGRPNMYGAAQPGMTQGMSAQAQISQAAAMQERQMMLERQRQALIMQQNAAVQQSTARRANNTLASQRPAIEDEETDDDNLAPVPPGSKILLANHQTPILQPPPNRVSQVAQASTASDKKSR